ncbi:hypothetical protein V6N13_039688 [Hibiscus sabdariffa]
MVGGSNRVLKMRLSDGFWFRWELNEVKGRWFRDNVGASHHQCWNLRSVGDTNFGAGMARWQPPGCAARSRALLESLSSREHAWTTGARTTPNCLSILSSGLGPQK